MKQISNKVHALALRAGALGASLLASGAALATDDYSAITTAADWTAVKADIIVVAGAVAVVLVVVRGSRMLLSMVRR